MHEFYSGTSEKGTLNLELIVLFLVERLSLSRRENNTLKY